MTIEELAAKREGLMREKDRILRDMDELKRRISQAKLAHWETGTRKQTNEWNAMNDGHEKLVSDLLLVEQGLTDIKPKIKAVNIEAAAAIDRKFERAFIIEARRVLPRDLYASIRDAALTAAGQAPGENIDQTGPDAAPSNDA